MEDFLLIQNNEDGSCTCGQMPVRIKTMLAYLEKVLGLRPDSSMDIPFPMQMLSATCFDHPIGTQLTMEQMNRVNHYSMSSDWDCCCEDFSEFVENKAVKLREPRFCSFYLETGIDEYDNGYGYGVFEFSRTYDEGPRITVPLALVLESGAVWGGGQP